MLEEATDAGRILDSDRPAIYTPAAVPAVLMATALGLNAVDETGKLGTTKKRKESDGSAVAGDEDEMFAVTLRIQEWSCGPEGDHRSGLPTITACVVRGSENAKAYAVRLKAHMLGAMAEAVLQ